MKYRIEFKKQIGFCNKAIYEIETINKENVTFKGYNYVFKLTEVIFLEHIKQ